MVSEPSICGISSKKMVWATLGGSSCGRCPDQYGGGVHGGGACHLFDEMPSQREATPGGVLHVTVSHVLYPVNEEVLHQVFDAYGAEQVVVLERADHVEALVRFRSSRDAERARDVTHGRCVYDGCCRLDVQYMQPSPSDSVVATPATCSTLGLSHNTDVLMAATTSAAATLTTSTTSAAETTTFLVTGARGAPHDELKELAPEETSKEPKETVQELCKKILATLDSMIESSHDINLDTSSNVIEPADHYVVSLPTPPATVKLSDIIVSSPMPPVAADSVRDHPEHFDDRKVFEQILNKSTMVLWPPTMKMTERQPCMPPVQVEVMGEGAELRLTLWLAFICYQGDSQSKQPWPPPPFHVEQQKLLSGINVQLKSSQAGVSQNKQQETNSTPLRSTTQEDPLAQIRSVIDEALKPMSKPLRSTARKDPLAQIKSAIDEAMKSIPEPVPDALAKLSHEVLDAAPPQLTELIMPFVKLIAPSSSNNKPSDEHADGSSSSSSGVPQTQVDLKANDETKDKEGLGSRPLDAQNSESSEARGLKSVLVEAPVAPSAKASQGQQASLYPSIEELLFSYNSGANKSVSKGMSDPQSKGRSVMPSASPPAPSAVPIFRPTPTQPKVYPSIWQSEANAKAASDNSESSPPHTFHRWIRCDGCGGKPIFGPRYKSNVKEDYDLCDACFRLMGNEVEYTRIDKPILPHRLLRDPNLCRKIYSRSVMKSKWEKLESRFILDVTVLEGTLRVPSTSFIKIWHMHNNGSIMWPLGTQLIWVGGDQFALQTSVPLEIPVNGFPVDEEIDVAVDFVAPARPGRYISYWRLASPTGQKFGQRVWVHIQVEDPSFVNDNKAAAINLNLPPESNSTNTSNLIDVNIEPMDQVFGEHVKSTKVELLEPLIYRGVTEPEKSEPAPCVVPSVSAAIPPHPIIDVPSSSVGAAAFVPIDVPAPELVTTPVPPPVNASTSLLTTIPVNVPAPAPAPAPAPTDVPSSEPLDIDDLTEEKLLKELEEMGFRQVDLNKEILRQNKYNLEQSVDDLCGINEWDPLLAELHEMGFDDTEMNKEVLSKNGGSIKRAVMDLIAREKKQK